MIIWFKYPLQIFTEAGELLPDEFCQEVSCLGKKGHECDYGYACTNTVTCHGLLCEENYECGDALCGTFTGDCTGTDCPDYSP
jgi:hypothetical protein